MADRDDRDEPPDGAGRGDQAGSAGRADQAGSAGRPDRKAVLLRLDPAVHRALARWATDDLRSLNAHVEWLLRRALSEAGRMPREAREPPRRGRPPG